MRDCENCEHYKDNGEARGCELWECDKDEKEYDDFDRSGEEWR